MGPATSGTTHVMGLFARGEHSWLWTDFKEATKKNFKKAMIMFVSDVFAFIICGRIIIAIIYLQTIIRF